MIKLRRSLPLLFVCGLILTNASAAQAQETPVAPVIANSPAQDAPANRPSYEVVLQLIKSAGANEEKTRLPAALAPITQKLQADFGQGDYSLILTFLNRVSEKGNLEVKAISSLNQNQPGDKTLNFYDMSLVGFKSNQTVPDAAQIDLLRFGIRVPIVTSYNVQEGKNVPGVINYEQLGITARPLGIRFNEPTIVGTLTTARPGEMLVLVMTVKPDAGSNQRTARKK